MERGADIHTKAERYLKGLIRVLPAEFKLFAAEFKALKAQYKKKISGMVVEDTWAFTNTWSETTWNDWVNCWLRIKLDCAHHLKDDVLSVTDWKTGKFREDMNEDYVEQLELYALAALILMPHLSEVRPRLVYVDNGMVYPPADKPLSFTRADVPKLKKLWEKRTRAMLNDARFAPRPNDKCRWCHFSKAKGGPCKF